MKDLEQALRSLGEEVKGRCNITEKRPRRADNKSGLQLTGYDLAVEETQLTDAGRQKGDRKRRSRRSLWRIRLHLACLETA